MKQISIPKLLRYGVGFLIFAMLLNQMIGWALVEKPFLERLWIGIKGSGSGGLIGAAVGVGAGLLALGSGGIGVAVAGAGYKLLGWATFGLIGFGAGSTVGGLVAVVKKPQNYDWNFWKLMIIVVICFALTSLALAIISKLGRRISRLIASDQVVAKLETQDNMTADSTAYSRESP